MLSLLALALWAQQAAEVRFESGAIWVTPGAGGSVAVYASDAADAPAVLGSSREEGGALIFTPRFPLRPGLACRVVYRTAAGAESVHRVRVPLAAVSPSARVAQVYPSGSVLPENQLKFYVHFSAPMSRGEAYRRIRLLDAAGKAVELPFLELDQELWDAAGKRLTLLFDPGRVKRDLMPNREVGQPLVAGRSYTLEIDAGWPDAEGAPMAAGFRKQFRVTAADRVSPAMNRWRLTAPRAGTREPLIVDLGEALDHGLLLRVLDVVGVAGESRTEAQETRWVFTPASPWARGSFDLRADVVLEDLAGNRLDRLFDEDRMAGGGGKGVVTRRRFVVR